MHGNSIRVVTIQGSVRPGNYTGKALNLVAHELRRNPGISVEMIDPAGLELVLPGLEGGAEPPPSCRKPFPTQPASCSQLRSTTEVSVASRN